MGERAADRTPDSGQGAAGSMTAREAAARLGVDERTIRRAIARGDLPAAKRAGAYRIAPADLAAYRAGHPAARDRAGATPAALAAIPLAPPRLRLVPPTEAGSTGSAGLPTPLTPLIGRDREVVDAREALLRPDVRLVTLTGPGGVGKTRLALEVAAGGEEAFADGVRFVPLAAVADPDLVLPTVAAALGLRESGERSAEATLRAALRGRHLLLVLDNFEQVVGAAPRLADLLAECPEVTALVTSRARLRLRGERVLAVPPLPTPDPDPAPDPDAVRANPAAELFLRRGRDVRPDVALTPANASAVAAICRRLDGLPLAIELAAARLDVLSPEALLARLEQQLGLLTGGARDLPERLRTMRAAIAWSHDLLAPEERRLFRRLAVFAGGWTLEAAEAVAGDDGDDAIAPRPRRGAPPPHREERGDPLGVLDHLTALVDSSLLRRTEGPGGADATGLRFGMLESVREFGLGHLAASGEEEETRRRHAMWCVDLAEQAEPWLIGKDGNAWLARLAAEHDNLRAALRWAETTGEPEIGLRLAGALMRFWFTRGHLREGREALERGLATAGSGGVPPRVRAKAVLGFGFLALHLGDFDQAGAALDEALALWRGLEDREGTARALEALGALAEYRGDDDQATAWREEALELFREQGNQRLVATMLENLADAAYRQGALDRAAALAGEALATSRAIDNPRVVVQTLVGAAQVACEQGDYSGATALLAEGFALAEAAGFWLGFADALSGCAAVAAALGRATGAVRLLAAAMAVCEEIGVPRLLHHEQYRRALAAARAALDEAAFAAAWDAGRALTPEQVRAEVEDALGAAPTPALATEARDPAARSGLTPREREVLRLLVEGRSDREIGAALFISRRTAMTHVANILAKLGVPSRTAAARAAAARGLL